MIIVMFSYFNKHQEKFVEGEAQFDSNVKALRFMYSIKGREDYILEGYRCDDPYDNEWLGRRINICQ